MGSGMENKKYTWKDIVNVNGKIFAEEFKISGEMVNGDNYNIDEFLNSVAEKYNVAAEEVKTYMLDNIDFDSSKMKFGTEECGCYINGIAEWTL